MRWSADLTAARNILAVLFPSREEAKVLLDESGVPTQRILFHFAAETMWHSALTEASNVGRAAALVESARTRYPNHAGLIGVAAQLASVYDSSPPEPDMMGIAPVVDLAIVAAMPAELVPVLELCGGRSSWRKVLRDGFVRHQTEWQCAGKTVSVLAGHLREFGGDATVAEVGRLAVLRPKVVALVGICAGRLSEEVSLGDVLIASRAFNPNEGKETAAGLGADTTTYMPPPWLVQQLRSHASLETNWQDSISLRHPAGGRSRVHVAPVASGAAVVAADNPFGRAAGQVRKVVGYDLEIKPFLSAAYDFGMAAFAVKGVCDGATPYKNDDYQPYAAEAAARWLYSFVTANAQYWPV